MSNYFQPMTNSASDGHPNAAPPNQCGQRSAPPNHMMHSYASFSLGSVVNSEVGKAYDYSGAAIRQNAIPHYMNSPNNNRASFYSNIGSYSSTEVGSSRMFSRKNNYESMGDFQMMPRANSDYKFSSLAASPYGSLAHPAGGSDRQQRTSRWNSVPLQQPWPMQQLQQQNHHRDYHSHSYNPNPAMAAASSFSNNKSSMISNDSGDNPSSMQLPSLPVVFHRPTPTVSSNTEFQRDFVGSARMERIATRVDVPKDNRPPRPSPTTSNPAPEVVSLMDNAVNAMNALSNLHDRWRAGGKRKERGERSSKAKRRRSRKRKNDRNSNNDGNFSNNNQPVILVCDKREEMGKEWIDIEDDGSSTQKRKLKPCGEKGFDLAYSVEDKCVPSLAPSKPQGETDDDDAALLTRLDKMPTSQLTSFAAVLGRTLYQKNDGIANQACKSQGVLSLVDGAEEMEISDGEEEEGKGDHPKVIETNQQKPDKSGEAPAVNVTKCIAKASVHGFPKNSISLHRSTVNAAQQNSSSSSNQDLGVMEKEKRALKLAELRAKAKLARVKLRIAEQKKAREADSVKASSQRKGHSPRSSPQPLQLGHSTSASCAPKLYDISAFREKCSLTIDDVAHTGPDEEVRFVESVYDLLLEGGQSTQEESPLQGAKMTGRKIVDFKTPFKVPSQDMNAIRPSDSQLSSEEKRKKSEALKQQLQLTRLQLEIKKKELKRKELERKKKGEEWALVASSETRNQESKPRPVLLNQNLCKERSDKMTELYENGSGIMEQNSYSADVIRNCDKLLNSQYQLQSGNSNHNNSSETVGNTPSFHGQAKPTIEQLPRSQPEPKKKNDTASLRNLIHRQQDLLKAQGQELTESTTQLQSCIDGIRTMHELLDKSEQRLEELNHRKRIMEGMVLRATEQLIVARRTLGEERQQQN